VKGRYSLDLNREDENRQRLVLKRRKLRIAPTFFTAYIDTIIGIWFGGNLRKST
jgi:hypothetical protein